MRVQFPSAPPNVALALLAFLFACRGDLNIIEAIAHTRSCWERGGDGDVAGVMGAWATVMEVASQPKHPFWYWAIDEFLNPSTNRGGEP